MNHFILRYDMDKYERTGIMAYHYDLYGIDRYLIDNGMKIEKWNSDISFYYDNAEGNVITDFICNDIDWPIVSDKFKNVIEAMNIKGIQYLPVNIIDKSSDRNLGNYYVVNIYNLLAEAINMEQSEHFELGPGHYAFVSYALSKEKVSNLDIFRLKESTIPMFISEKFKKIIEDNKLTGFSFTKIKIV